MTSRELEELRRRLDQGDGSDEDLEEIANLVAEELERRKRERPTGQIRIRTGDVCRRILPTGHVDPHTPPARVEEVDGFDVLLETCEVVDSWRLVSLDQLRGRRSHRNGWQ